MLCQGNNKQVNMTLQYGQPIIGAHSLKRQDRKIKLFMLYTQAGTHNSQEPSKLCLTKVGMNEFWELRRHEGMRNILSINK